MKVLVLKELCIGCALCESTCADVFDMQDNIAVVKVETVTEALIPAATEAAKSCPTEAIKIA